MQLRQQGARSAAAAAPHRRASRPVARRPGAARGQPVVAAAAATVAGPGDIACVDYALRNGSEEVDAGSAQFAVGGGDVIKGFDVAVTGLAVGESRTAQLSPDIAYGAVREDYIVQLPRARAPSGLQVGDEVQLSNGLEATVTAIEGDATSGNVTLDLNHPLAGKDLELQVTLRSLVPGASLVKATFGAGCFWGPELAFQRVPGVIATEVGYSQGTVKDPTYEQVCSGSTGHVEVVQVTYDPGEVTYRALLDEFFRRHDPTALNRQGGDVGTQYRAGIYTHTPEQADEAAKYLAEKREAMPGVRIVTELQPVNMYYKAEAYHQQYLAKGGRFGQAQDPSKGCTDPVRCYG